MTLIDTSVWIDFFNNRATKQVHLLEELINDNADICTCGIVLTEILQGIRSDVEYRRVKRYFGSFLFLQMTQPVFVKAADIYRSLRQQGITIRKSIDCMIAATAIVHNVKLLHNDKDFDPIGRHCKLKAFR